MLIYLSILYVQVLIWLFCSSQATSFNLSRLRLGDMLKVQKTGKFLCLVQALVYGKRWPASQRRVFPFNGAAAHPIRKISPGACLLALEQHKHDLPPN